MADNEVSGQSKRTRSTSYPASSLEKSIEHVSQVKASLGRGPFDRDSAARAIGHGAGVTGASATKIAAMVHYGLLTRKGSTYELSQLAESIITPRDFPEKQAAIVQAAQRPRLFSALLKKYEGRGMPTMLNHILVRDHGIGERVANDVKKTFEATMKFAGLLENGVLRKTDTELDDVDDVSPTTGFRPSSEPVAIKDNSPASSDVQKVEIGEGLVVSYPANIAFRLLTSSDFSEALKSLHKALKPQGSDATGISQDEKNENE